MLRHKPGTTWPEVFDRCLSAAPEAFLPDGAKNLESGRWTTSAEPRVHASPIDGSAIQGASRMCRRDVERAVSSAVREHRQWSTVPIDERRERVLEAVDEMGRHRDLLALLLMWEIGKTWHSACADVDRALGGVRWYADQIERQMVGRRPLDGPVSNVASWNYPMSVLVHAEMVQMLAGNAVVAKTPSKGGFHALTLAHAFMARAGLPSTLVSGSGEALGEAMICSDGVGAFAYVGGRENARKIEPVLASMAKAGQRHIVEQEGLNVWGIWDFSQWDELARHLRSGFEYGKQRCTAYPRYVVQRSLFPDFLACYTGVVQGLRVGNPFAVSSPEEALPDLDFGPLISASKAADLQDRFDEGMRLGGVPLLRTELDHSLFLQGQDTAAYLPPAALLAPPTQWSLHHREPFGPLDSIVLVDTEHELLSGMNVSHGSLVASLATDDLDLASRLVPEIQAFKVGVNRPRSRGDREEVFGGRGRSWRGAFVGGDLLVHAVTEPTEGRRTPLYGNFDGLTALPPEGRADLVATA